MSVRLGVVTKVRDVFIGSLLLLGSACTSMTAQPSSTSGVDSPELLIRPGDDLAVYVWRHDDLNVTIRVNEDGTISIPLAGQISVSNLTVKEAKTEIGQKLEKHISNPHVTVIVSQSTTDGSEPRIRVTGYVQKPISMRWRQGVTVLEALLAAGGVEQDEHQLSACLYRSDGSRGPVNLDHLLNGTDLNTNYVMGAGDTLVIFQPDVVDSDASCLLDTLS